MDPNSSLVKICLGDDVVVISSDKVEGSGDRNSPEYQDTAVSKGKKVVNTLSFYKMETDEISERYIAPCLVNGLEAYDGEVNLEYDENLISNKFAVKLCLDYEVKIGKNLVKKELIVALKRELYFVKFIINPEEDDSKPGVILERSFLRIAYGLVDFDNGVITIYPEPDLFEDDYEKTGKSSNDWDQILDFNFDDVPKFGEELPLFICKMRKRNHNKKRIIKNLNLFYQYIRPSSSPEGYLTQKEAEKEALAVRISQKFALLEEERPVIKTMAYNDKYKKILDEILRYKVELYGKTVKEEEDAVKRIKGETLKEKDDPSAFIFPIRLEGKVNENALADTGPDINTMPYQIYETLGREEMKKIDRGITIINHTHTEAMGKLYNVLYHVGVTTIIAKFLILDIPINRDAPIVVSRGFIYTMGSILNISDRLFSTFDGVCHQSFRSARFDVLRTAKSDSDDEEEYVIERNRFGAIIYGPKPAPYLNYTNLEDRSSAIQTSIGSPIIRARILKKKKKQTLKTYDEEAGSSRSKRPRQHETVEEMLLPQVHHKFLLWEGCSRDAKSRDIHFVAWIRAFNINEPIYAQLFYEFYSTYEFDEVCVGDELQSKKIIRFRLGGREDVVRSLSALIYCRDLDTITLRYLIDSDGKLILEDPQLGVPRVGIPRPPRASIQDLYDRMGRIEIRQEAI
nr:hypothetical protein [Tanacetum cinerariifolium]